MKKQTIIIILLLAAFTAASFVFSFIDLEISRQIANSNSRWAKFLEDYGMIPGLLVILSSIYIYYSSIKAKSSFRSYIQKVVFFLVSSGLIFYLFDILLGQTVFDNVITYSIISFSISLAIFSVLHLKIQVQNDVTIRYARVVAGMAMFGYIISIQGVKYFWGRVRFRELDAVFSQFTPWYLPQGLTGFDSFPSGHAAMGWMLLPLLILISGKKGWIKYSMFILIFIWAVVLALSRVVIGAHYASDVLFGSFFIITAFSVFSKLYYSTDRR